MKLLIILLSLITVFSCTKDPEGNSSGKTFESERITDVNLISNIPAEDLIEVGPIVGAVEKNSAVFLFATKEPARVRVQISENENFANAFFTEEFRSETVNYNYVKIFYDKLDPDTKYFYRAVINDQPDGTTNSFRTFPDKKDYSFSFGFGSCQQGWSESSPVIFPVIGNDSLRFFIHLGDWTYPDRNISRDFSTSRDKLEQSYRVKYNGNYPFYSEVLSKMPVSYLYDDHDYAGNDSDGEHPGKQNAINAYRDFFPHYELPNPGNGIWQKFGFSDVEFFLLDLRSQRNKNSGALDSQGNYAPSNDHSILAGFDIDGEDQRTWLINSLKNSTAKWKVIVSSVVFNPKYADAAEDPQIAASFPRIVNGIIDKWAGFPGDIDELTKAIENNNIKNVIIVSGDSHSSYIDDGTNSIIPEISSSNLDVKNSNIDFLINLAGYSIWNKGSLTGDKYAYGKVSFVFGSEDYALLEIIDDSRSVVASHKIIAE
jgi:phosphodiesterase/alkaline phosphatase D-like protein